MRAKCINEMNFKRGEEPTSALGVGILGQVKFELADGYVPGDYNEWHWFWDEAYGMIAPYKGKWTVSLFLNFGTDWVKPINKAAAFLGFLGIPFIIDNPKNNFDNVDNEQLILVFDTQDDLEKKLNLPKE